MHLAEHPHLHVIEKMAVIGPAPGLIRRHEIAQPLTRLDEDRVLIGAVVALAVLKLAPQPVQMDRMLHHGVVDEHEAYALILCEMDGRSLGKFLAVKAPDEALHIAGEMQHDLARGWPLVIARLERAQIGITQDTPAVVVEPGARLTETPL